MNVWSEDGDRLTRLISDDDLQAVGQVIKECGSAKPNLISKLGPD
jgi:hypothetical protein